MNPNAPITLLASALTASLLFPMTSVSAVSTSPAEGTHHVEVDSQIARKNRRREPVPCHTMAVTRTFLSVSADQLGWNEEDWVTRFTDLRQLGFSEVILKYSSTEDIELFARSMPDEVQHSPIGAMTRAAASTRMRIWLGLHKESAPATYPGRDIEELPSVLAERLERIEDRLYPLVLSTLSADPNQNVYRGWYLPDTIDGQDWINPERNKHYAHYLGGLHAMLNRLQPEWPIMMSAILNTSNADPESLIDAWKQLTDFAGANVFLFELSQLAKAADPGSADTRTSKWSTSKWLELVSRELERDQLSVGATIRLFDQLNDDRVRAASFTDLRQALGSIRHYGREPLTVQPIPRHLLDEKDWSSINLRKRWIRDQKACRGTPSRLVEQALPARFTPQV